MNWDQIKGKWKQLTGDLQSMWGNLTDDDLQRAGGDREKLEGILQERYGKSKEEIRKEVDDWMKQKA